jgi:hypothetical protein
MQALIPLFWKYADRIKHMSVSFEMFQQVETHGGILACKGAATEKISFLFDMQILPDGFPKQKKDPSVPVSF